MGKHLEQALPSVYTLQCLTGKVDNNNNNIPLSPLTYMELEYLSLRSCRLIKYFFTQLILKIKYGLEFNFVDLIHC